MKVGFTIFITGIIIAAIGVVFWQYGNSYSQSLYDLIESGNTKLDIARVAEASGLGIIVLGGGLAIGGLVRMILKR